MGKYNSIKADAAWFSINEIEQAFEIANNAIKSAAKISYSNSNNPLELTALSYEQLMRASLGLYSVKKKDEVVERP